MNSVRIIFLTLVFSPALYAISSLNTFRAYDRNLIKPYRTKNMAWDVALSTEHSLSIKGISSLTQPNDPSIKCADVNVLKLWHAEQNALAMLKGFDPTSAIGSLAQQLNVDNDNGIRGHIDICGDLSVPLHMIGSARWYLPHGFIVGAYLPFMVMHLTTSFKDKTQSITAEDLLTKNLLTNDLAGNMRRLGELDITGWRRAGIGDLAVVVDWYRDFPQEKPLLRQVTTKVRFGISVPTGRKHDPDKIMSLPFGNDGAWGILLGGALDLHMLKYLKAGIDIEFLHLLTSVQERRIKTNLSQTDLFLLAKTCVHMDFGFTHRFNLFAELFNLWDCFSLSWAYQLWKHEDDRITVVNNRFDSTVANTAKNLEEWATHHFIYAAHVDFENIIHEGASAIPYLSVFYKQPINGRNALLAHTLGVSLSVSF